MSSASYPFTAGAGSAGYLARLWQLRYFIFSLVTVDLRNRYRKSFLGIGWSLMRPLAMTAIFCLVFCSLLGVPMSDYAPYALVGLTIWQFICESVLCGCLSIVQGGHYVRQQPLPLALFPLRTVLSSAFHALIALALAIGLAWVFQGPKNPLPLLSLVPTLILLFFLGWSLAIIGSVSYTHFHDTQYLLEILLQLFFYLTPIFYKLDTIRERAGNVWLLELNPFRFVVEVIRWPILHGELPSLTSYSAFLLFVVGVGVVAIGVLKRWERNLVFWV